MRIAQEGFRAVTCPFDRPSADPLRGPEADHLLGIDEDLGAEAAADIRRDDAQLVLGRDADEGGDHEPGHMRVLARGVEREMVFARIVVADGRARLHRVRHEAVVDDVEARHMRRAGEGRVGGRLVAERPLEDHVVWRDVVDLRATARLSRLHHGRQLAIGHVHELGRRLGLSQRLRHDDRDMVADIAHLALREHGVRARLHGRSVLGVDHPAADETADLVLRDVVAGQHRDHARGLPRLGRVDTLDGCVGVRGAHEIGVGLAGEVDVVGVAALAGDEALVLLADDARADARAAHERASEPMLDAPA